MYTHTYTYMHLYLHNRQHVCLLLRDKYISVLAVLWSMSLAYTVCRANWIPANMHGTTSLMTWSHALSHLQTSGVLKNLRVYLEITESDRMEWHSSHGKLGNVHSGMLLLQTPSLSHMCLSRHSVLAVLQN